MPRSDKFAEYRTTVTGAESGEIVVTYVRTAIVRFDAKRVTLDSGGWRTVTTKRKMNQAARQFGLPYSVYQEAGDWFVRLDTGAVVSFADGMSFDRA